MNRTMLALAFFAIGLGVGAVVTDSVFEERTHKTRVALAVCLDDQSILLTKLQEVGDLLVQGAPILRECTVLRRQFNDSMIHGGAPLTIMPGTSDCSQLVGGCAGR